ncbi:hypothetical protein DFH28DRAFT_910475 [Melampsora americana]|nr:hypothetical protein DFH28DRAFT_910475 [Melampsora americana]
MPPLSPSPSSLNALLNPIEEVELPGSISRNKSWAEQMELEDSEADSMVEETTPTATPSPPGLATFWNALLKRKDINGSLTLSENETSLMTSLIANLINQSSANEKSIQITAITSKLNGLQKSVNNLLQTHARQIETKSWSQVAKGNMTGQTKTKTVDAKIEDEQILVKGVTRLQSGNLKIYAKSRTVTKWLFEHKHQWTHRADPLLVTPPSKYLVILHSIPTTFEPTNISFKTDLCQENSIDHTKIQNIKWLGRPKDDGKAHGSIIVILLDKEVAAKVERGGLFLKNMYLPRAKYNRPPMQCYRCLEMNHSARFCPNEPLCSSCGGNHETRACNIEDTDLRCVKCWNTAKESNKGNPPDPNDEKFAHSVFSSTCPLKKEAAPQNRRYFMSKEI